MKLEHALKRVELIRELADTPLQEVAANEIEHFIKEQGIRIHEQDNQLVQQLDWYLENRKLKEIIKKLEKKIDDILENVS